MLSLAIGALQLMLDRGQLKDWFGSTEIWIEATIAALGLLPVDRPHVTATDRSFLNRDLLKSPQFRHRHAADVPDRRILSGTLALMPTMLQHLMHYPVMTTGLVTAPRGIGTMIGDVPGRRG